MKEYLDREFVAAGWMDSGGKIACEMQNMVYENLLELLTVFSTQGHSGSSAPYVIDLFSKLAKFEPIVPLTGDDSEWESDSDGLFQNKRYSSVFKGGGRFDGQPYDSTAIIFWEWYTNPDTKEVVKTYFTNCKSAVPITFPYTPEVKYQEYTPNQGG